VYALDANRVVRRYRRRAVPDEEVAIMRYVRERGYPAPLVHDVAGNDLVLERITGASMARDLFRRPWLVTTHARLLADLHRRLHAVPPPDWLTGAGPELAHGDLHPENVLLSPSGPVVIDWANATRAGAGFDVAMSAVITGGAPVGRPWSWLRDAFVREFLRGFVRGEWTAAWPDAVAYRLRDRNVSDSEKARVRELRF
jgi:tRNA A-37 threonylcarbamoyl transferase component Bud32